MLWSRRGRASGLQCTAHLRHLGRRKHRDRERRSVRWRYDRPPAPERGGRYRRRRKQQLDAVYTGQYVDQCVPRRKYRYGYDYSLSNLCGGDGCGGTVPLFAEATVTAPLLPDCIPTNGSGPAPTTTVPSWMPHGPDGGIVASIDCPGSSCGFCSSVSGTRRTTLQAFNLLALITGVTLMGLRARARRRQLDRPR